MHDKVDPWMLQTPDNTKDEIFQGMLADMRNGVAYPFYKNKLIFYTIPETKWLYRIHLFSQYEGSLNQLYEDGRYLTNYLFDNYSDLQKLYGITPHVGMQRVGPKIGWKLEGVLSKSHMKKNMTLVDQRVFGVTREENLSQRNL